MNATLDKAITRGIKLAMWILSGGVALLLILTVLIFGGFFNE